MALRAIQKGHRGPKGRRRDLEERARLASTHCTDSNRTGRSRLFWTGGTASQWMTSKVTSKLMLWRT
eukprot:307060-Amphidinium_carterae.1